MTGRAKEFALHALAVSLVAFVLHYAWEYVQCSLFVHLASPATPVGMIPPALGDVALTWVAQLTTAAVTGRWLWAADARWPARAWLALIATALMLSVPLELYALSTDRWAYTDAQPLIPGLGVGLTPVLQLLLLFPATFALVGRILRSTGQ